MDDTPPAPLVKGPLGPRLATVRGLLPRWETYVFLGVSAMLNNVVLLLLTNAYVLCPDRRDARRIAVPIYDNGVLTGEDVTIEDGRACEVAGGALFVVQSVLIVVIYAACAFATRSATTTFFAAEPAPGPGPAGVGQSLSFSAPVLIQPIGFGLGSGAFSLRLSAPFLIAVPHSSHAAQSGLAQCISACSGYLW